MPICKKCGSKKIVKNGFVLGRQRYHCNNCGYNFREGDNRINDETIAKKSLCLLLYALAKGSYRIFGRILGVEHSQVFYWIRESGDRLPEPEESGGINKMNYDEMLEYISSDAISIDSSKPVTVAHGELSDGYKIVMLLQPPSKTKKDSN